MKMRTRGNRTGERCVRVCGVCVCVWSLPWLFPMVWVLVPGESQAGELGLTCQFTMASASALSAQVTCSQMVAFCAWSLAGAKSPRDMCWQQLTWTELYCLSRSCIIIKAHALCPWWAPRSWALLLTLLSIEQVDGKPDLLVTRNIQGGAGVNGRQSHDVCRD